MTQVYRTLRVAPGDKGVLSVVIDAPPMNLIGPELVRDLVSLLGELESGQQARVVVLESADPEYFVPHVDLTKVAEYTAEAAKAGGPGDASLGMLWHKLSELPVVTIAKIRGRARGAGSELALACDMRFAARENAILGQIEVGVGALPGAGGVQHLGPLLGRGRAMEAILGADDFDAETAERYGWINRALPDADLDAFVARLARRIASFPADGVRSAKRVLNELTMPGADAIRANAVRFRQLVVSDPAQARTAALSRRACRPAARSSSTSATASEPCNGYDEGRPAMARPARTRSTPLAAVVAGLLAGAAGTVCLDAVHYLKYRRAGGTDGPLAWEFARVRNWETAPAPGQVARRVLEGFTQRKLPNRSAWLTSTIAHWAYGSAAGAAYAIVAGSLLAPHPRYGVPFGAAVLPRLHRPAGRRALPADLGVRRQDPGLGPRRPPRLRRGHRNHVLAADQNRLDRGLRPETKQPGPARNPGH